MFFLVEGDVSEVATVDTDMLGGKEACENVATAWVKAPSDAGCVDLEILCMVTVCSFVLLSGSDESGAVRVTFEDNISEVGFMESVLVCTLLTGDITSVESLEVVDFRDVGFVENDCSSVVRCRVNSAVLVFCALVLCVVFVDGSVTPSVSDVLIAVLVGVSLVDITSEVVIVDPDRLGEMEVNVGGVDVIGIVLVSSN